MRNIIKKLTYRSLVALAAAGVAGLAVGCGGGDSKSADQPVTGAANAAPAAAAGNSAPVGGPFSPDPGGKVVAVQLTTDGTGNYFTPAEVHAKVGDVVRFGLKVGVHNVHFLADSNAGHTGYPPTPSDFLQLPGQTWDVLLHLPKGTYYFQCDPHAALGMKGHLIVE